MIYLERHDTARNMARFYCLTVERNLFGGWSLVCDWGRIGRTRQTRIALYDTLQSAQEAYARKLREKQRRGYQ